MGRDRVSRPDRANFSCGAIANGNDEIHLRCMRPPELVPALAAQVIDRMPLLFEHLYSYRIYLPRWMAARAVRLEATLAYLVQESLRHHAASGVSSAQKEDVIRGIHARFSPPGACSRRRLP